MTQQQGCGEGKSFFFYGMVIRRLLFFALVGCSDHPAKFDKVDATADVVTPTRRVAPKHYPEFKDDLDFAAMRQALLRQIKRFENRPMNKTIRLDRDVYPVSQIEESLRVFLEMVDETQACLAQARRDETARSSCYRDLNLGIKSRFFVYAPDVIGENPGYGKAEPALFTGYYTPLLRVSYRRSSRYNWGIYSRPEMEEDRIKTRQEIDFQGALAGTGSTLFFAQDLFELYLMHIEGGGRVEVSENGRLKYYYLSYAGTNSQKFEWISKYMVSKGYINDYSILSQKRFLRKNPDKWEEIYSTCPSYVYFKITSTPPLGSDDVPLTDGRSLATDDEFYPFKGMLTFVRSRRLREEVATDSAVATKDDFQDFSRFFLDQDTGGAIRGKARADIYFGEGEYAEVASSLMKQNGQIYFLILKPGT